MKIMFIGHVYHKTTASSEFFLKILRSLGTIDYVWDEGILTGQHMDVSLEWQRADLIVVWQIEYIVPRLVEKGFKKVLFVPMFDGAEQLGADYWLKLESVFILCFSYTLYNRLQKCGLSRLLYVQYFPDPRDHKMVNQNGGLRVFFWQRRTEPSWKTVKIIIGTQRCEGVTLKVALDPVPSEKSVRPSIEDRNKYNINEIAWSVSRSDSIRQQCACNVYVAPRMVEGIGMSFLEAMASGMAVCARDYPTMNEYVVNGSNGFLYNSLDLKEIDLGKRKEVGLRARAFVERGFRRWERDVSRILEWIETICGKEKQKHLVNSSGIDAQKFKGCDARVKSLVTVAVVARNAEKEIGKTLQSICRQDYEEIEVVVVDGASCDGTMTEVRKYAGRISRMVSEPDEGPYDGMNKAVRLSTGKWILFLNAGDVFYCDSALSDVMALAPDDAEFIVGNHVYRGITGVEIINAVRPFYDTWNDLQNGRVTERWLSGIPCHQSTLTKRELLMVEPYNADRYHIAADHELMFRACKKGARFFAVPFLISVYQGGGLSAQSFERCIEEWWQIAGTYTDNRRAVDRFYRAKRVKAGLVRRLGFTRSELRRRLNGVSIVYRPWLLVKLLGAIWRRGGKRKIGIEMAADEQTLNNVRFEGFGESEGWGRWTVGFTAKVVFCYKLVGKVRIVILFRSVSASNVGKTIGITLGKLDKEVRLGRRGGVVSLDFEADEGLSEIIIRVPTPLGTDGTHNDDCRAIGVGVSFIDIVASGVVDRVHEVVSEAAD